MSNPSHLMCFNSLRFRKLNTVLTSLTCAALAACGKHDQPNPAAMRPPALVTVATVITQDVPLYLDEIGRCVAREVVSIQPQVTGQITQIHFKDGATITKGDLLFTIDPRPYEAALAQRIAAFEESTAELDLARIEFSHVDEMLKVQAASRQEFDVKKSAVAAAEARTKLAQALIDVAKINLNYCFIKSPITGRAGQRMVDAGNVVKTEGNTSLLMIQALDPIYADFTITESELPQVRERMAQGTLVTQVRLPNDIEPHVGELTFLDSVVQDATGTVRLRATLPNTDFHFWPGQFVRVRLVLTVLTGARLIPSQAAQISQQGTYVYLVGKDSTAELRPVKLGQRHGDLIVTTEGIQSGDVVMLTGHMGVMPGGQVRIEKPATPPAADSSAPTSQPGVTR